MSPEISLVRQTDAKALNAVCNDPAVRPWLGGQGELELSALVADSRNVVLLEPGASGGCIFTFIEPGYYELHTQFTRKGRHLARKFVRQALFEMFLHTDCMELYTRVPEANSVARRFTESFGPALQAELPSLGLDGSRTLVRLYRLSFAEWCLTERHELGRTSQAAGLPPDPYVGATLRMLFSVALVKGATLYTRYSMVAGFPPITVLTAVPPRIMLGSNVLETLPRCQ